MAIKLENDSGYVYETVYIDEAVLEALQYVIDNFNN